MTMYSSRRQFIKLGMFFGISVMIGRLPDAHALEVHSGPSPLDWMSPDGKARYRWDALRKVTGQKTFARDFRARDLSGWPKEQAHAFFIKATRADRIFEGVDLSLLGPKLQPDRSAAGKSGSRVLWQKLSGSQRADAASDRTSGGASGVPRFRSL